MELGSAPLIVRPFSLPVLVKGNTGIEEKDGEWYVYAPVALTDEEDYDKHILSKAGVDRGLVMHDRLGGHIDYQHRYKKSKNLDDIVGQRVKTIEINGVTNVVARLLKSKPETPKIWNHLKDGGNLGFSLDGLCKAVDPRNSKRVTDTEIHLITIDPMPKGYEGTRLKVGLPAGVVPTLGQIVKSLTDELASGDLHNWCDASFDLDGEIVKALTVGDGAVTPDMTGAIATRTEHLEGGKRLHDQWRCPTCEKLNKKTRAKCRNCGLGRGVTRKPGTR